VRGKGTFLAKNVGRQFAGKNFQSPFHSTVPTKYHLFTKRNQTKTKPSIERRAELSKKPDQ